MQALNDWFRTHVELDPERPERLRSLWYAVAFDIGLFLSRINKQDEQIIAANN